MRIKLGHRISFAFMAITAVILLSVYASLNISLSRDTYDITRENLGKKLELAKVFVEDGYTGYSAAADGMDKAADVIGKALGDRITIIDSSGKVLGDSELPFPKVMAMENHLYRKEVQDALRIGAGESKRFSTTLRRDMLYMASAIKAVHHKETVVRIAVPLSAVEQISKRLKGTLLMSLIGAFLLSFAIGTIVSRKISGPIDRMVNDIKGISEGDLSKRVVVPAGNEMEDLSQAFNGLLERIETLFKDIEAGKSNLEAILLSMYDGIMVVDRKGDVLLVNNALKGLIDFSGDVAGRKPLEVLRSVELQNIAEDVMATGRPVNMKEINVIMPDKKVLLVNAAPVVMEGELQGAVLAFHDITEFRKLENVRKEFVANVSHELRTPLSSIKGYAETLMGGAIKDEENAVEFVKIIHEEAIRLESLVKDILDLSRIESGKVEREKKAFSAHDMAGKVCLRVVKGAADKGISVENDIPLGKFDMLGDENMIAQCLFNLVDNAVKYTDRGGTVKISAEGKEGFIAISVSDNGVGIPEKDLPRIFERFYRVDKARSRESGGTGLGLSIVKHIVQLHGGEIFVKSAPGSGSTFTFTIPKA